MKFLIVFGLAFATVSAKYLYSRSIEVSVPQCLPHSRIVNGNTATPGQFKYQAGISLKKGPVYIWCSGSLIGQSWILSAAHCTFDALSAMIFLGANERLSPEKVYIVKHDAIINHPFWNPFILANDISLIRLPTNNALGSGIAIIRIPSNSSNTYLNDSVVVAGWGRTNDNIECSKTLQYAILKVSPGHICSEAYGLYYNNHVRICVATPDRVSTCGGDSGGALVLEKEDLQIGVLSYGDSFGCDRGSPTIYTRVSAYLAWIKSHTEVAIETSKL